MGGLARERPRHIESLTPSASSFSVAPADAGEMSGLEFGRMQPKGASLFHVRAGEVARQVHYLNSNLAFADLALTPEGDAADPSA